MLIFQGGGIGGRRLCLHHDRLDLNARAGITERAEQRCKVNGHFNKLVWRVRCGAERSIRHWHPSWRRSRGRHGCDKSRAVWNATGKVDISIGRDRRRRRRGSRAWAVGTLPLRNRECGYRASLTIISRYQEIAESSSSIRSSGGEVAARRLVAAGLNIPCQRVLQKLEIDVAGSVSGESVAGGGDPAMAIGRLRDMNIDVVHIGLIINCPGFPEPSRIRIIVDAARGWGKRIIASAAAVCWILAPVCNGRVLGNTGIE